MPARTRSFKPSSVVKPAVVKPASKTRKSSILQTIDKTKYSHIVERWNEEFIVVGDVISDLDKIPELFEFRNPYTSSSDTSRIYEIPYHTFYSLFGLKWSEIQNLTSGVLVKFIRDGQYVCVDKLV